MLCSGLTSLPIAVLIEFDHYTGPAITTAEGKKLVPIPPIRHTWEGTKGACSRMQVPIILAWAITVLLEIFFLDHFLLIDFNVLKIARGYKKGWQKKDD